MMKGPLHPPSVLYEKNQPLSLRVASIGAFVLLVVVILLLLSRHSLLASAPGAVGVQIVALMLMIWARITFGRRSFHAAANPTEGGLSTEGPYRVLRHPIYAAVLYFIWAGVASEGSLLDWALGAAATTGIAVRIYAEERLLVAAYPDYAGYAARTKRVLPFVF
jgi:protein-S-isoprenylcysteine O-methyltransferase Ste14